jgi:hypothetical protein
MGIRRTGVGTNVIVATLRLSRAVPGHTDRGEEGYKGHRHRGHGHGYRGHQHEYRGYGQRHHGHRGPRVFISPRLVAPFGPYWEPSGDPPAVLAPSPRWQATPPRLSRGFRETGLRLPSLVIHLSQCIMRLRHVPVHSNFQTASSPKPLFGGSCPAAPPRRSGDSRCAKTHKLCQILVS